MDKKVIGKTEDGLKHQLATIIKGWGMEFMELAEKLKAEGMRDLSEKGDGLLGKWELKIRDELRPLQERMLQDVMNLVGTGYQGTGRPCGCGGWLKYEGLLKAEIRTLVGTIILKRAYYCDRCCQKKEIPLDKALGIEGYKWSPGLRQIMALAGSECSFERASELLSQMSGLVIDDNTIERISQSVGEELEEEEKKERTNRYLNLASQEPAKRRIYMEVDGGRIPLRESWREVKLGSIFEGLKGKEGDKRGETRYFGGIYDNVSEFVNIWRNEAKAMGADKTQELIALGDGAVWIWNQVAEEFPQALQILDYYHALEHAVKVAVAVMGEGTKESQEWLKYIGEKLRKGKLQQILEELEQLKVKNRKNGKLIQDTIKYYQNNAHRMEYDKYLAKGYFIGSGVIESACRHLSNQRLKVAGARWDKENANDILWIRIARANGTWDKYWKGYRKCA